MLSFFPGLLKYDQTKNGFSDLLECRKNTKKHTNKKEKKKHIKKPLFSIQVFSNMIKTKNGFSDLVESGKVKNTQPTKEKNTTLFKIEI